MQRCLAVAFIWSLPPHNECAATFSTLHSTLYLYSAWGCFGPEEHLAIHFWHSFAVLAIGFIPAVNSSNYRQYLHGQESPSGSLFSDQSNTLLFCSLIELIFCRIKHLKTGIESRRIQNRIFAFKIEHIVHQIIDLLHFVSENNLVFV